MVSNFLTGLQIFDLSPGAMSTRKVCAITIHSRASTEHAWLYKRRDVADYTRTRIAKGVCPIPGTGMRALRAQIIIGPALIVDFERLMSPSLSVLLQKCSVVF